MKKNVYLQQIESLDEVPLLKAEIFRINEQFPDEMTSVSNLSSGQCSLKRLRVVVKTWVNNNLFSFLCLDDDFFSQTGKVKVVRNFAFPTQPHDARYFFINDGQNHARAALENPSANRKKRVSILGLEYTSKDDAQKASWEERAKDDKERYEREVAEFSGSEWLLQACSSPNASLGAISGKLIWWICSVFVYGISNLFKSITSLI